MLYLLLLVGILLKGWESDLEALKTRGVLIEVRLRRIGMWRLRDLRERLGISVVLER